MEIDAAAEYYLDHELETLVKQKRVLTFGDNPVSYTHLRAHETVLDLVCRLLLEKKKITKHYINMITRKAKQQNCNCTHNKKVLEIHE